MVVRFYYDVSGLLMLHDGTKRWQFMNNFFYWSGWLLLFKIHLQHNGVNSSILHNVDVLGFKQKKPKLFSLSWIFLMMEDNIGHCNTSSVTASNHFIDIS